MGSRSKARARAQASVVPDQPAQGRPPQGRPPTIAAAAIVEAVQALTILAAAILAGVATSEGQSYQTSSGIAITLIGIGTAAALGYVATGLARSRHWSRTPALLTQLFTGVIGIYLIQGQRYIYWGVPAVVLSIVGLVLLLVPASIKALTASHDNPSAMVK